jgi:hypothetical protein
MLIPLENLFGLCGSILLLIPPARDQFMRFRFLYLKKRYGEPALREYVDVIAAGYETERNSWSFWDSLSMAFGALLLGASYIVAL